MFMPSNNNTLSDPMIFSGRQSLIPAIPRRRKLRNHGIAVAFRHRATQKKHSEGKSSSPVRLWEGLQKCQVSARKLAAGLWQWRCMEVSCDGGDVFRYAPLFPSSKYQLANGSVKITFPHHHNYGEKHKEIKHHQRKPITILRSRNRFRCELESSMACPNSKEATKWNPGSLNNEAFNEFTIIHGMKHLEDHKIVGDCYFGVNNLLQLLRAQRSINKLKATHKSSKKRVAQLLHNNNLEEDKNVLWKCRECQKIETMLHDLKDKLARERRGRERMELLNRKLVHELSKANLSTKQYMANYKKEKEERKMIAEVCNELAMQVREDTAKLERLLSDSEKNCKEVEEEREMMEMAELWRQEGMQMKLADAQFLLEDKYNQMVQLIAFLQMFLRSKGAEVDTNELEDSQLIKQAVESVNIKQIVELSYDFSKSDDTFSVFEELRKDNTEEGAVKPIRECVASISLKPGFHTTLTSPLSTIHIEGLGEEEVLNKSSIMHQKSPSNDYNSGLGQTNNSSETIGYIEDERLSSMPQRGGTYSVNVNKGKDILSSEEAECSQKACQLRSSPNNGGKRFSSIKSSQHKRLRDGWNMQKECNYRLPTSSMQNAAGTNSQCKSSVDGRFQHSELMEQGNSTYNMNPHIIRAMRGCTKWPQGIPKSNFKVTPYERSEKKKKKEREISVASYSTKAQELFIKVLN